MDGAGTPQWGATLAKKLEQAQIQTRVFHPFPWQLWHWSRSVFKTSLLLRWIYFILKANIRNHRKVCMIDKKIVYTGSLNISQTHLHKSSGGDEWRDTGIKLIHTDLSPLQEAFELGHNLVAFFDLLAKLDQKDKATLYQNGATSGIIQI